MVFKPEYLLILGFTIVVDYYAGIWIENAVGKQRKWFLILSLVANIGVLAFFKYTNFAIFALAQANIAHYKLLDFILPIGLSFHTFQAMSYTIEVYRGNQKAEKHFGLYALYVMFYPQLVAGPIERPQNVLHQFYEKKSFDYQRVTSGLKLMAWGLFKKVVIADRLTLFVDKVYDTPTQYEGVPIIIATIFFTFQIYCDFSGYSDIALGSAEVMGFKLMKNFDRPYFSKSISEFWRRWHISLSTWFRDYLYIPLGGNRVSKTRQNFNQFFVFAVSGLWHGANWNFIIWGALHGFYLIFARITQKPRAYFNKITGLEKVPFILKTVQAFTTFCLVAFAWIFFRGNYLEQSQCWHLVTHLFSNLPSTKEFLTYNYIAKNVFLEFTMVEFLIAVGLIIFMEIIHYIQRDKSIRQIVSNYPTALRWTLYYLFIMAFFILGIFDQPAKFIYFQF
ncbi:alginate O-acetyltransferase [Emticicia aquatilis]|uniref:Alginate O-acetyltransferase n=2 Tax=Emticicia aquatilis TaxID=1537369 RepID=A0A917DNV9_9BACT|nr:alginate O-acetyltransferase [Emticicia aquatilis]